MTGYELHESCTAVQSCLNQQRDLSCTGSPLQALQIPVTLHVGPYIKPVLHSRAQEQG